MKRLLLALVSVFVASAAHGAPITYGFFQGGFESGGFVAGYFIAEDFNRDGFISYGVFGGGQATPECGRNGLPPCELLDYHMSFISNSHVVFSHDFLTAFDLPIVSDSTSNRWGIHFRIGSSTIPEGNWLPEGCNIFDDAKPCTSSPEGFIASHGPDTGDGFYTAWRAGIYERIDNFCADFEPQCGAIGDFHIFAGDTTTERVHIFAIPEPHPLTLISIALVGLAFIRRRAMSIA